jgi:hypothetical protein
VSIHKNDHNLKHELLLFFDIQNCIHMLLPSCDDVHCTPQFSTLFKNIILGNSS